MDINQLVDRRVKVRSAQLFSNAVTVAIRDVDPDTSSLLLEFLLPAQVGQETYRFAVARPRLEGDDLEMLLKSGVLGCGITCIPQDHFDVAQPFNLSWWRGGGAAIGDVLL